MYGPDLRDKALELARWHSGDAPGTETEFTWAYEENPAGDVIYCGADTPEMLAGQYVVVPRTFRFENKEPVRAALTVGMLTRPEFRRQGVFTACAGEVFTSCVEKDIAVIVGVPNQNSYPGFVKKLEFQDLGTFRTLIYPFRLLPQLPVQLKKRRARLALRLVARRLQPVSSGGQHVALRTIEPVGREHSVDPFGTRYDELWSRCREHYPPNMVVRSGAYLSWRYARRPSRSYAVHEALVGGELRGFAVSCSHTSRPVPWLSVRVGYLADLLWERQDSSVIRALVGGMLRTLRADGAHYCVAQCCPGTDAERELVAAGFLSLPDAAGVVFNHADRFILRRTVDEAAESVTDPGRWYWTYGDNDIV